MTRLMTLSVREKSLVFTYTFTQAENPEKLREMVAKSGAHSTDLQSPETVEHLCAKCDQYAKDWQPAADKLWTR